MNEPTRDIERVGGGAVPIRSTHDSGTWARTTEA